MLKTVASSLRSHLGVSCGNYGTACSRFAGAAVATAAGDAERNRLINKLLYRSRQRGFLELDLLVGLWAEQEVPKMDIDMLQQFTVVLDQENPDLFKWLTGQQEAPSDLSSNRAYQALQQHVKQQLADSCHAASQAAHGKEWLRGWDDSWRSNSKDKQEGSGAQAQAPSS